MRLLYTALVVLALFFTGFTAQSQHLKPGFDKQEYTDLLRLTFRQDSMLKQAPQPRYTILYHSPDMGLDNGWDLYLRKDSVAVINIHGTKNNMISWMENFYAAMVPAKGELRVAKDYTFHYQLAANPRAAVHAGWLVGTAFLARDIVPRIDSCYKKGIKEFIIAGHSQGGAISYLMTSYLYNLKNSGNLPADIRFKTYCSAGPKPGNLFYAAEYEGTINRDWAFNVVNSADWVPETPVSIQTLNDFNATNPFVNANTVIRAQKFPKRLIFRRVYNQLNKPARKAQNNYQRYLGKETSKFIKKHLPGYEAPVYVNSSNYVRTGNIITLFADEAYSRYFLKVKKKLLCITCSSPTSTWQKN